MGEPRQWAEVGYGSKRDCKERREEMEERATEPKKVEKADGASVQRNQKRRKEWRRGSEDGRGLKGREEDEMGRWMNERKAARMNENQKQGVKIWRARRWRMGQMTKRKERAVHRCRCRKRGSVKRQARWETVLWPSRDKLLPLTRIYACSHFVLLA